MNNSICNECFFRNECKMREPTAEVASCYCYKHDTRITNADRIRAMSDEELALLLSTLPRAYPKNGFDPTCKNCWLYWLRQEANT